MNKFVIVLLLAVTLAYVVQALQVYDFDTPELEGEQVYPDRDEYVDNNLLPESEKRSSKIFVYRRGCIHRGDACDHRPNECCFSSSCRCNLWGTNCRCQRVGLFQKWG